MWRLLKSKGSESIVKNLGALTQPLADERETMLFVFEASKKAFHPGAPPDFFADFPYGHSAFKSPRAGSSWLWSVRSNWAL